LTKEEINLGNNYSYIFNEKENRYKLCHNRIEFPARPDKIFKFYAFNLNNIASVYSNYFYLSNPKQFNDPFDCNLNLVKLDKRSISKEKLNQPLNDISNVGISCFTQDIRNPIMWGKYSDNYTGFVIEFEPELFQMMAHKELLTSFNPVIYLDKFRKVKSSDEFSMEYLLTVKDKRWEHEMEWRIVQIVEEEDDRICKFNTEGVKAIYIGHKLADNYQSQYHFLTEMFEEKYPNRKINVVYPNPEKLGLTLECINENYIK